MPDGFRIEQALFGYRDGHHLVAASVELAPRVRQFLATVTDGSGSDSSSGFDTAFTGMPVPETNFYALFCTWPAPEMFRPGCVWSHVLLIELADLARIPNLVMLCKLFERPAVPPFRPSYERHLHLGAFNSPFVTAVDENRSALLLSTIYGHPEKCVVVLDFENDSWSDSVFSIWSQQWPRLRRSFIFSTGSLDDRRASGVVFDLQIAPLSSQRLWGRDGALTLVVDFSFPPIATGFQPWISTALNDLRNDTEGRLREFLHLYGSDVESPREAFARLVDWFDGPKFGEDDDPSDRLELLAKAFPKETDAVLLKRDELSAPAKSADLDALDSVWAAVYFLLISQSTIAFSRVPFDFALHTSTLWQQKRADVLALLGILPNSKRSTEFLCALANVIAPGDIPIIWREQAAALPHVVLYKPALASDPTAWAMPEDGQRAFWEGLRAATSDQNIWAFICGAMLRAQCNLAERETVTLAGTALASGLQSWLEADWLRLPSGEWREALSQPLARALHENVLSVPLLAFAAWTLPCNEARSLSGHRTDVQTLARKGLIGMPEPLILPTYFWLATLGYQTSGEDGFSLLSCAFFQVYDAVARSQYPREAWELLAPVLPEARVGLDWDRCRRLRRALRGWLRKNSGFTDAMSRAAPTAERARLVRNLA